MRLTTDEVIETLRKQNVASVADVKYGVIEPDGTLTVIPRQAKQPVTADMLGLSPRDAGLPLVVVSGRQAGQPFTAAAAPRPRDIENRLNNQSIALSDVFLMTLDDCGNTFLQRKEGR